ncbi:hypothetical protein Ddc_21573 [Ditylenchus destructor]|nr:hypothetical protein Ddc_21573 [Ditylenchus destructor]
MGLFFWRALTHPLRRSVLAHWRRQITALPTAATPAAGRTHRDERMRYRPPGQHARQCKQRRRCDQGDREWQAPGQCRLESATVAAKVNWTNTSTIRKNGIPITHIRASPRTES